MSASTLPLDVRRTMIAGPAPVMFHRWERLLFLHWRMPAGVLQNILPPGLTIDTFNGDAWLGIVAFCMRDIRILGLPRIPTTTNFLELNLRTYVQDEAGRQGVWFISLDANSRLAVHGARAWYHLPYRHARMTAAVDAATGEVDYRSRRRGSPADAGSRFVYRPAGLPRTAEPDTLEQFLIERYLLFSVDRRGRVLSGRVSHPPYVFTDVDLTFCDDRLIQLGGLPTPGRPPEHAVVASGVSVDVYGLEPMDAPACP